MCVAFGFLNKIYDCRTFIGFSFAIRIVEAVGNSAFLSASFTLVAKMFPNAVSSQLSTPPLYCTVLYRCRQYSGAWR